MLARRTNLLLEETDYLLLRALTKKHKVSMGELIRRALEKTYKDEVRLEEREKTVTAIQGLWKKMGLQRIDYKSLIEDGRKN